MRLVKKHQSLGTKITIFATTVIIIASVLIAISVYLISHQFFIASSREALISRTDLITSEIEGWMNKPRKDLFTLLKTPAVQGIIRSTKNNGIDTLDNSTLKSWKKRLSIIFESLLKTNHDYTQIRYIGVKNNGREIVRVDQRNGITYKRSESALQKKNDRLYYKRAISLSQGSIGYSDISYNMEKGKLSLPLTLTQRIYAPVFTKDQVVFGFLIINIDMNQYLQRIFNNLNIKYNIYLYDKEKNVFAYDKKHKVLHYYPNLEKLKEKKLKLPKYMQKIDTEKLIKTILNNKKNITITSKIYTTKNRDRQIFTLVNSIPKKMVLNDDDRLAKYILFITFIISIMASFTVYIYTKKSMTHLSDLADQINQLKTGDIDKVKLPTNLNDEVGLLARSFEKKTKQLNQVAHYDSLTGLPNRANFYTHLHEAINRAKRTNKLLVLFYIDINEFKSVNDRFGHDYGDKLLVQVSKKLKKLTRKTDFPSRLSGDEFVIYFENFDKEGDIEKIRLKFEKSLSTTYLIKGAEINITISGGISIFPNYADNIEMLLKQADQMMYASKKEGVGRFFYYGKDNDRL